MNKVLHNKWAAIVLASLLVVPNVAAAQQPRPLDGTKGRTQDTQHHSITIHNKAMLNSYTTFSCSNKGCQFAAENTVAEPAPLPSGNSSTTVKQSVTGEAGPAPTASDRYSSSDTHADDEGAVRCRDGEQVGAADSSEYREVGGAIAEALASAISPRGKMES